MHVLADNPLIADCEDGAIRLVGGATASEGTVGTECGEVFVTIGGTLPMQM